MQINISRSTTFSVVLELYNLLPLSVHDYPFYMPLFIFNVVSVFIWLPSDGGLDYQKGWCMPVSENKFVRLKMLLQCF